ncbi:MAG TPA: SRPBCC domain-containing protein [Ignavibacteriales bacterium]|nr:SRPBCC domain-containing protein [Ignavibacteriales bacterium]HEX3075163.1 SRPBCC domain-containing protein [Ignavibacteriales bacterium]
MEEKIVGLTKDAGFQFGLRKTFPLSVEEVWGFMFSKEGISIWLGNMDISVLEKDTEYKTKKGIEGVVKVFKPYSHIRMRWKKKDWENVSTLQIRVMPTGNKATIGFHQENMLNAAQREKMKAYWNGIMEELARKLKEK